LTHPKRRSYLRLPACPTLEQAKPQKREFNPAMRTLPYSGRRRVDSRSLDPRVLAGSAFCKFCTHTQSEITEGWVMEYKQSATAARNDKEVETKTPASEPPVERFFTTPGVNPTNELARDLSTDSSAGENLKPVFEQKSLAVVAMKEVLAVRVWAWAISAARESSFAVAFGCLLMGIVLFVAWRPEVPALAATLLGVGSFALGAAVGKEFDYRLHTRRSAAEREQARRENRKKKPTKASPTKVTPAKE
jgi:hypothetical protein